MIRAAWGKGSAGWVTAALLLLVSGHARAELTVCNGGGERLRYAVVADDSLLPVLFPNWVMQGWVELGSGCRTLIGGPRLARAYLSVQRYDQTGNWTLAFYGGGNRSRGGSNSEEAHRVFCIGEGSFRRSEGVLEAHETCPAGYYRQLFNLYLGSSSDVNFTMTLN